MHATDRPPGHAMEVGHLVGGRQVGELRPGERRRTFDVAADGESVGGRVERRPGRVDRIDPPAAREHLLDSVGDDPPDVVQRTADLTVEPASDDDPGSSRCHDAQEGGSTDAAFAHAAAIPVPIGQETPVPPIPQ